ncbi:MAG: IS1595 family transposase [Chloracidobacterium sp.]|nr:IS1595 family transposase [Chloracidobacterium sp.]
MKAAVKPKMKRYTVKDFRNQFPTDDACLEYLKDLLYPEGITCKKCEKITKHHKVASRRSYSCQICGHHVHPTAGTIYHKSTTPLTDWFYAVFLMASTRCGISAKQLERELGVTYKTAWRMFKQIRSMLDESDADKLTGKVEVDETYIGGKHIGTNIRGRNTKTKAVVAGAVERDGGKVKTKVIPEEALRPYLILSAILSRLNRPYLPTNGSPTTKSKITATPTTAFITVNGFMCKAKIIQIPLKAFGQSSKVALKAFTGTRAVSIYKAMSMNTRFVTTAETTKRLCFFSFLVRFANPLTSLFLRRPENPLARTFLRRLPRFLGRPD